MPEILGFGNSILEAFIIEVGGAGDTQPSKEKVHKTSQDAQTTPDDIEYKPGLCSSTSRIPAVI